MIRTSVLSLSLCIVGTILAHGQTLQDLRGGSGAYYTFAEPSDITVQIKVWGAVSNPGLYEVRQGLTLSTLLSLAGGAQMTAAGRAKSRLTIRLFRADAAGGSQRLVKEVVMQNEILTFDDDPQLLNGDMLIVEEEVRQRFGWRDFLSIVTTTASIVLVVERIVRLTE